MTFWMKSIFLLKNVLLLKVVSFDLWTLCLKFLQFFWPPINEIFWLGRFKCCLKKNVDGEKLFGAVYLIKCGRNPDKGLVSFTTFYSLLLRSSSCYCLVSFTTFCSQNSYIWEERPHVTVVKKINNGKIVSVPFYTFGHVYSILVDMYISYLKL